MKSLSSVPSNKSWSKELIPREIHERHEAGEPLCPQFVTDLELLGAGVQFFRTRRNALENPGISYQSVDKKRARSRRNKNWSAKLVCQEIRAWHEAGKPLYSQYMRENYQALLGAGVRYHKTWRKAVEHSGLVYESVRKNRVWTKELIIETVQRLSKEGCDLSLSSMKLSCYSSMVYAAIRKHHFGSWKDTLIAAGLPPREIYRYRYRNDEEIVGEIRRLNEMERDLSFKNIYATSPTLVATARRRFGSWGAALQLAGIDYSDVRIRGSWTIEKIVDEIRKLQVQGISLNSGKVRKTHPTLFAAACKPRSFGSWSNAVLVALNGVPFSESVERIS